MSKNYQFLQKMTLIFLSLCVKSKECRLLNDSYVRLRFIYKPPGIQDWKTHGHWLIRIVITNPPTHLTILIVSEYIAGWGIFSSENVAEFVMLQIFKQRLQEGSHEALSYPGQT